MFEKLKRKKNLVIAACLFLIFIVGLFPSDNNISNNNTNYFIDTNAIFDALIQARSLEAELEQRYQLTAIILHWKRLSRAQLTVQYYLNTDFFKEIIVWNNNPQINLTVNEFLTNNQSHNLVRIINSKENLKDEAKYRACTEAKTHVCFYADDDWDVFHYMNTLIASFRSDPNLLHSATNVVTYYNNMLWTFMDSRIDLHTGFSWIGCGSVFLREHAQRHLQLLTMNLKTNQELFAFSDLFFSIWLNDIPSQMVVNLRALPTNVNETDIPFSSTNSFYDFQHTSSVLAIRKLEYSLRLNQSKRSISFPRQQYRRFPYCVKSPSSKDDFIFYSNILPVDIEHIPFDITRDAERGTYRNVPGGPNYTHFVDYNTLKAVDNDETTCWRPLGLVKKGDFFAIDFLRIQTDIIFSLTIGHSEKVQNSLKMRISFDGMWWLSHESLKGITTDINRKPIAKFKRLVIDSRQFPPELQSFRYVAFNATHALDEAFQVCDVQRIKSSTINTK
ncbi:unnamed protein product [Rotaria sp. Silwood2]|nr:unnamed protein product [Rotaria sp. Silwood2]CAF2624716.1 unnamed protein product [Rotaria sp. Silwood2]CAF3198080.1 unnamed protein product [Rotaria sp. Silwood2]CAF3294246.1 unnamed protein product [Rotaria sp. Silwood2]CAF4317672.1 unnamed protein product [Rotaria sp. Silwood2]